MRRLVVIDTVKMRVHYYTVGDYVEVNDEYVSNMGFNLNNCSWACGEFNFIYHRGKLV